jgi:hypothetical protein
MTNRWWVRSLAIALAVGAAAAGGTTLRLSVATRTPSAMLSERGDEESPAPLALPAPQDWDRYNAPYDGRYHFMRIRYSFSRGGMRGVRGRGPPWSHDYPRGERNFTKLLDAMTYVHPLVDGSNIYPFDDPHLFENPIAYLIEVSAWEPTDAEVAGLREYLLKGGFLIVDDFRDRYALENLEFQMNRVLPGVQLVQLDASHEIFDSFFRVDPHQVIPPYGPQDPVWYGIHEDNDRTKRLMAIINYDNDISEYWEFSDMGYYPVDLANDAYKLGVNYIIYGMTH